MDNNPDLEKIVLSNKKVFVLVKNGLDKSLVRNIVIKTTEFLLPIVFWIGMVVIFVLSFSIASTQWKFWAQVTTFFATLVPYSLTFIVSFYLIYLLKDIKDSLQNK